MATIGTILHTLFFGKRIGKDQFGNVYYQNRSPDENGKYRRWVVYKGIAEPSKVPPEWHGWLHYTTDIIPKQRYGWQKDHVPNLTGTDLAYFPPGHIKGEGKRRKATGDYEAWRPEGSEKA